MSREKTPWYTVVDIQTGFELFEIQFYEDSFSHGVSGFTFDDPDGELWICKMIDEKNFLIFGELMDEYLYKMLEEQEGISSSFEYYVVEG